MNDIDTIYYNKMGIAFQWKRCPVRHMNKVQLVFRDVGFLLTLEELQLFSENIASVLVQSKGCEGCPHRQNCRNILLETPAPQITLAVNRKELSAADDLVRGTLFQLHLNDFVSNL